MAYCDIDDVQSILPNGVVVGTNLSDENVNALTSDVEAWIDFAAQEIDAYLSSIYRVPLVQRRIPDFTVTPITYSNVYPAPIPLINARLAAAHIYDNVIMADQKPNVSDWGKNIRALAMDDLKLVQNGSIQLGGQMRRGMRFVRQELLDHPRVSLRDPQQGPNRAPGQ